ncbi:MAG: L-aspartate oxidase [Xanthomonadaceae bacterium]|jgi:L-aspartate oxidase|nr:L-aspartate oxidase [Xanthomonadaceae bacterium]
MIVIIGSGLAGLTAASVASKHDDVTLITKARIADSNTQHAQGGVAAAIAPGDSSELHANDTLAAGHGLCDPEAVRILTEDGAQRIRELIAAGTPFDHDSNGQLSQALEAAHSVPRVLHSGGDATGAAIETAMIERIAHCGIQLLEQTFLSDLVVERGRVTGVRVIASGMETTIAADAVILASGGAGQLYSHTTNPSVATGDGAAAAWRAGATLADCEFFQFHPTSLAMPGNTLVSEAVRGAGAVLLDENGRRFMRDAHPLAELAPRDVVAETIARVMRTQGGRPVFLDATALSDKFSDRFPSIAAACAAWKLDPGKDLLPVTPAAHYWMGGVRTDLDGRTSLPGLYAAGEVACTGVHGANRLASNSLLEALVFGHRAACAARTSVENQHWPRWSATEITDDDDATSLSSTPPTLQEIQAIMWSDVGISRNRLGLKRAEERFRSWLGSFACASIMLGPETSQEAQRISTADLEIRNLVTLGAIITRAAIARTESRGAHRREDYPRLDPNQAHRTNYRNTPYARTDAIPLPLPHAHVGNSR